MSDSQQKCGTVALIGEANAGKSSLLNALVGTSVAITAAMAGTTRQAIRGILNIDHAQIIFVDTPGMQKARNLLEKQMSRSISGAVKTADVICFVLDVTNVTPSALSKLANYRDFGVPVLLALTKIDCARPEKILYALDQVKQYDFIKEFLPVSAHKRIGLDDLIRSLIQYLPAGPAIYAADEYTDSSERTLTAEIIRGAVINHTKDEVPAGVKVTLTKFNTKERTIEIAADIICDKPNHKKIIIGNQGKMIRAIGITARRDLEKMLGRHVDLTTFVVVRPGWRDKVDYLQNQ